MATENLKSAFDGKLLINTITKAAPDHLKDSLKEIYNNAVSRTKEEQAELDKKSDRESMAQTMNSLLYFYKKNSGLEGDMFQDTFSAYQPKTPKQKAAKNACMRFVTNLESSKKGLFIYGDVGRGKSHLLRATLLGIYDKGWKEGVKKCLYFYAPELERIMFRNNDVENDLNNCDYLFLDDISKLSGETSKSWFLNIIGVLFDRAERTGQPVISCTSNDSIQELSYSLGEPFTSRIRALMDVVEIDGEDARK